MSLIKTDLNLNNGIYAIALIENMFFIWNKIEKMIPILCKLGKYCESGAI